MQTPFFERLLACAQTEGTLSFLVFLTDGVGYIVSVTLLLYRDFSPSRGEEASGGEGGGDVAELELFERMAGICGAAVLLLVVLSAVFFRRVLRRLPPFELAKLQRAQIADGDGAS